MKLPQKYDRRRKVTPEQDKEIVNLYNSGRGYTYATLGARYGITPAAIGFIIAGRPSKPGQIKATEPVEVIKERRSLRTKVANKIIREWLESFEDGDYSANDKEMAKAALTRFYAHYAYGGRKSSANLTDEQRKERARKAAITRWQK